MPTRRDPAAAHEGRRRPVLVRRRERGRRALGRPAVRGRRLPREPRNHGRGAARRFHGSVVIQWHTPPGSTRIDFAGSEALVRDDSLDRLLHSDLWPRLAVDIGAARSRGTPDKPNPHVTVCFARRPARSDDGPGGALTIGTAVFLPVGEPRGKPCKGDWRYTLTLHGWFVVNAGRNAIDGLDAPADRDPADTADLARKWNRRLWDAGVLPHILPALEHFVTRARLDRAEAWALTEALADSDLFTRHAAQICSQHQWVYCLADRLLELPPPRGGVALNAAGEHPRPSGPPARQRPVGHVPRGRGAPPELRRAGRSHPGLPAGVAPGQRASGRLRSLLYRHPAPGQGLRVLGSPAPAPA